MLGAIIGDTVGSVYEFNNIRSKDFALFSKDSFLTDDSIMTLAVAEIMKKGHINDKEKIIDTLKKWGRKYPDRGYGGSFYRWLFGNSREPYYSYGNGAAMRISPVAWYANNEDEVRDFSKKVTEVTHDHPEGLKGAEVTAMCVYYARIGKTKQFIEEYVKQFYNIDFNYKELKQTYWFNETCQDTVPQAIYCFLISKNFEDCIRTTISIGGDCDTTAAISCAIAGAYYGIPKKFKDKILTYLNKEMREILNVEKIEY
jgi:type I restriction enzyme M protein